MLSDIHSAVQVGTGHDPRFTLGGRCLHNAFLLVAVFAGHLHVLMTQELPPTCTSTCNIQPFCIASANLIYPIYILRRNKATKTSTECILDHQKVSTFSNPIYSYHKLTIFVLYIKLQILSSTG